MGLKGKITFEKEIKCNGDVFLDLFKQKTNDLANITPDHIQGCDLLEGEFGALGSVNLWKYTDDGKEKCLKTVLEAIDVENKLLRFKGVEGDLFQSFKEFVTSIHVHKNGDHNLVTWTIAYEKLNEDVPEPIANLNIAINLTNDIEGHHAE